MRSNIEKTESFDTNFLMHYYCNQELKIHIFSILSSYFEFCDRIVMKVYTCPLEGSG
jgi:hypothetical protein